MPDGYALDLDLSRSDADLQNAAEGSPQHVLTLKEQRAFDVDGARAEWRVAEGVFVAYL